MLLEMAQMGTLSMNSFTVLGPRNSQIKVCLHYFHNGTGVKKRKKERICIHFWLATVRMLTRIQISGAGFLRKEDIIETFILFLLKYSISESTNHSIA